MLQNNRLLTVNIIQIYFFFKSSGLTGIGNKSLDTNQSHLFQNVLSLQNYIKIK